MRFIGRHLVLGIAIALLGTAQPSVTDNGSQRVTVKLVGCDDCSSSAINVSLWDETQDDEIAVPAKQSGADLTLRLAPGYYRLLISTQRCGGDPFVGVLPQRDRVAYVKVRCSKSHYSSGRLVDAARGLAGAIPQAAASIVALPAEVYPDPAKPVNAATIDNGAYYLDETDCRFCVLEVTLRNGKKVRLAARAGQKNFSLTVRDISARDLLNGVPADESPFNSPEALAEGPAHTIWALDPLGNRVDVFGPGRSFRSINLPTQFADAGQIIGTSDAVWVSERRVGKLVRFGPNGSQTEIPIANVETPQNLKIAKGRDGRIWFAYDTDAGAVDETGHVDHYPPDFPVFWIKDLTAGQDDHTWFVGLSTSYGAGGKFLAAVDRQGHWKKYVLPDDVDNDRVLGAASGTWVVGSYWSVHFVDWAGHITKANLPIREMGPTPFLVDGTDGLWFTDMYGNITARATPDGKVNAAYSSDFGRPGITDMRAGASGKVLIAWNTAGGIAQFGASPSAMELVQPTPRTIKPKYILVDSSGSVWFSDPDADVVGAFLKNNGQTCFGLPLSNIRACPHVSATP